MYDEEHDRFYDSKCTSEYRECPCSRTDVQVEDATPADTTVVLLNELLQRVLDHGVTVKISRYNSPITVTLKIGE